MGAGRPDWAENTADDLFIYLIYLITQDRLLKSISQSVALWSEAAQNIDAVRWRLVSTNRQSLWRERWAVCGLCIPRWARSAVFYNKRSSSTLWQRPHLAGVECTENTLAGGGWARHGCTRGEWEGVHSHWWPLIRRRSAWIVDRRLETDQPYHVEYSASSLSRHKTLRPLLPSTVNWSDHTV